MNSSSFSDELSVNYIRGEEDLYDDTNVSFLLNQNFSKLEEDFLPNETILWELFGKFKIYYVPFIVIMGVTGNNLIGAVLLFTPSKFRPSSYFLSSLAIADTCFLLNMFIYYLQEFVFHTGGRTIFCRYQNYISRISSSLSIWYTVGYTIERYIAVQYPTLLDSMRTPRRTVVAIATLTAMVAIIYLHIFLINDEQCNPFETFLKFAWQFFITETVLTFFIPFLTILTMNCLIVRQLIKFNPFSVEVNGDTSEGTMTTSYRGRCSQHSTNVSSSGDGGKSPVDNQPSVQDYYQLSDVKSKNATGWNSELLRSYVSHCKLQTGARMLINIKRINCSNRPDASLNRNVGIVVKPEEPRTKEVNDNNEYLQAERVSPSENSPGISAKDWPSCGMEVIKAKVKIYERGTKMYARKVAVHKHDKILTIKKNIGTHDKAGPCESLEMSTEADGDDSSKMARSSSTQASSESTSSSSLPQSTSPTTTLLYDSSNDSVMSSNKIDLLNETQYLTQTNSPTNLSIIEKNLIQCPGSQHLISQVDKSTDGVTTGNETNSPKNFSLNTRMKGRTVPATEYMEVVSTNLEYKPLNINPTARITHNCVPESIIDQSIRDHFEGSPHSCIDLNVRDDSLSNSKVNTNLKSEEENITATTEPFNNCLNQSIKVQITTESVTDGYSEHLELKKNNLKERENDTTEPCTIMDVTNLAEPFFFQYFRSFSRKKYTLPKSTKKSFNHHKTSEPIRETRTTFRHCSSYRRIKKYHNTTVMLIITSSVFLALHFPK